MSVFSQLMRNFWYLYTLGFLFIIQDLDVKYKPENSGVKKEYFQLSPKLLKVIDNTLGYKKYENYTLQTATTENNFNYMLNMLVQLVVSPILFFKYLVYNSKKKRTIAQETHTENLPRNVKGRQPTKIENPDKFRLIKNEKNLSMLQSNLLKYENRSAWWMLILFFESIIFIICGPAYIFCQQLMFPCSFVMDGFELRTILESFGFKMKIIPITNLEYYI